MRALAAGDPRDLCQGSPRRAAMGPRRTELLHRASPALAEVASSAPASPVPPRRRAPLGPRLPPVARPWPPARPTLHGAPVFFLPMRDAGSRCLLFAADDVACCCCVAAVAEAFCSCYAACSPTPADAATTDRYTFRPGLRWQPEVEEYFARISQGLAMNFLVDLMV
ncbi:hypothetical protein ZWY2020_021365 [Hordeum vulgare]|nr:hypothetical protein ZWY2020_021365 [Hordeum vulgare]